MIEISSDRLMKSFKIDVLKFGTKWMEGEGVVAKLNVDGRVIEYLIENTRLSSRPSWKRMTIRD